MAEFSPDVQAILDELDGKKSNDFSPETKAILKQYETAPVGGAGAFDAQGNPVSNYIPSTATPQETVGPGKRSYDAVINSLQGPYGPPDLPAGTNPVGNFAYNALIQKPLYGLDFVSRPLMAAGSGLGGLAAGLGESSGLLDRTGADVMQRDLSLFGQSALTVAGATPSVRGFYQKPPKASAPLVPLASQEAARVGGGYLKEADGTPAPVPTFDAPPGRTFDVAPDGSTTPLQGPGTSLAVTTPARAVEPDPIPSGVSLGSIPTSSVPVGEVSPVSPVSESTAGAQQYSGPAQTMSRAEAKARQSRDESVQLEQADPDRRVGGIDTNPYVPGVQRTLGDMDLSHAAEEGALRDMFPEPFDKRDTANNLALIDHAEQGIKDPIAIGNMQTARDAQAAKDIAPMKQAPKPVDLQPVKDLVLNQLSEGAEDRGLIKSTLTNVLDTLSDKDGNLRTDPNRAYNGIRKNITDMLERAKTDPKSNEATAAQHLIEIKEQLDNQIAATNPSFRTYLDNYTKPSGPIDEATLMNDIRRRITNAKGIVQLGKIDSVLNDLYTARNIKSGASRALHVSDDTMQRLYDIRNQLQANAARDDMMSTVGSNTHLRILQGQKYLAPAPSPVKNMLMNAAEAGLHGAANLVDPTSFTANALIRYGGDKLGRAKAEKAATEAAARTAAQQAAQKSRLDQFLNPQIGHNGGPPLDDGGPPTQGFNSAPSPKSGGAAATPNALINDYTPTTDLARSYQTNALQNPPNIKAYHGSGSDFDQFDNSKIGTGEGAQAYGHGLYFADSEKVAQSYRDAISNKQTGIKVDGKPIEQAGLSPSAIQIAQMQLDGTIKNMPELKTWHEAKIKDYQSKVDANPNDQVAFHNLNLEKSWRDAIDQLDGKQLSYSPNKGHLYEVNIHADPDHFLDWDKPLSQQSDHVQDALKTIPWAEPYLNTPFNGSQIAPHTAEGAQQLQAAGIKGIRYLDQQSRNAGDWNITPPSQTVSGKWMVKSSDYNSKGLHFDNEADARAALAEKMSQQTSNHVVFDPATIEIIRKYGLAGLIGGGSAMAGSRSDQ